MIACMWTFRAMTIEPCAWQILGQTMEKLDAQQYKGTWYEFYRNDENTGENGDCIRAIYSDNKESNRVTVTNSKLNGPREN